MKKRDYQKNLNRINALSFFVLNLYYKNKDIVDDLDFLKIIQKELIAQEGLIKNVLFKAWSLEKLFLSGFDPKRIEIGKEWSLSDIREEFYYISCRVNAPSRLKFLIELAELDLNSIS